MVTWMFPGQGTQFKGMGKDLFATFANQVQEADEILGYSIQDLCLKDPDKNLGNTEFTQPALFIINALLTLQAFEQYGSKPDFTAGHSLGEYNALFAAGVFDFATGLRIVMQRGQLMAQAQPGGMAAVIDSGDKTQSVLDQHHLDDIYIANYNSPTQTVISGPEQSIQQAKPIFAQHNITFIPLKVSGAFHSPYMQGPSEAFADFIQSCSFSEPSIPVIANVNARPYQFEKIQENMVSQITGAVRWVDSVRYLMGKGVLEFVELGPKKALTKMVNQITSNCDPLIVTENPTNNPAAEQPEPTPQAEKVAAKKTSKISPEDLGSASFKQDYRLKYAYICGAMAKGIASTDIVVAMGKAGLMGFFGAGGLPLSKIENAIRTIQQQLASGESYGINMLHQPDDPAAEHALVDLFIQYGVPCIEASAFMQVTPALVKYRLLGIAQTADGHINSQHKLIAKLSRPEVANAFLAPPPKRMVDDLLQSGLITPEAAALAHRLPMADDITVEADSGGHTDMGVMTALLPAMLKLRDEWVHKQHYTQPIRIGAGGGIGSPEAAAAAFILGADYILTGSINQSTVEADTSETVKDILQSLNVQDTDYAPAGDMFEIGAKVQVVRKGIFFPARANKLFELYRQYPSIEAIDQKIQTQLQERFFQRSFAEVYQDTVSYHSQKSPHKLEKAERDAKHKMALIFRWYFGYSSRLAKQGDISRKVDFQIHCGPSMGLFNQWVKSTDLADWRQRHVSDLADQLMHETADYLNQKISSLTQ